MMAVRQLGSYSKQSVREMATKLISEAKLSRKTVNFKAESGNDVQLEAVYEDSLSSGSSLGTVIAFHGSPGSHNDFKYIRNHMDKMSIRFIGVNYPGFNQTDGYTDQKHSNIERQSYSNALLDELNIQGKVIYMGHSRGCENALMTATDRNAHGLVMINPIGFRIHKGLRPMSRLESIEYIYTCLPKFIGNAIMLKIYQSIGFKIQNGEEAINALRSMIKTALHNQLEFVEKLNKLETKQLFVFAGKDHLMEEEIIFEALEKYEGLKHFNFDKEVSPEEKQPVLDAYDTNKGVSVYVANDTHFQNKLRADLVASVVQKMLTQNVNKL